MKLKASVQQRLQSAEQTEPTKWGAGDYESNRSLIFKIYKELQKLNSPPNHLTHRQVTK